MCLQNAFNVPRKVRRLNEIDGDPLELPLAVAPFIKFLVLLSAKMLAWLRK